MFVLVIIKSEIVVHLSHLSPYFTLKKNGIHIEFYNFLQTIFVSQSIREKCSLYREKEKAWLCKFSTNSLFMSVLCRDVIGIGNKSQSHPHCRTEALQLLKIFLSPLAFHRVFVFYGFLRINFANILRRHAVSTV